MGPAPMTSAGAPRPSLAALDGVEADAERLDQRQLVVGELLGLVQQPHRNGEQTAHAAIDVHAHHLQILAAIGLAKQAGMACGVVDVGLDRAAVAGGDAAAVVRDGKHFHAKLMAEHARVGEKRLPAGEGMQIGAADADAADSNQRFFRPRAGRRRRFVCEFARTVQYNLPHLDARIPNRPANGQLH